jgi:hypothetical protein
MKQKLFSTILILFTTGLLVLTACGDSPPPAPVSITIELDEFSYLVHDFDLKDFRVGQEVTLTLVNSGVLEHEIMFGRNLVSGGNGMPMGYEIDFFVSAGVEPIVEMTETVENDQHEDDHSEEVMDNGMEEMDNDDGELDHADEEADGDHGHAGFMVSIAPGEEGYTIQFTVTEDMIGEWEIGCFLLEGVHYTSGMFLEMQVSS